MSAAERPPSLMLPFALVGAAAGALAAGVLANPLLRAVPAADPLAAPVVTALVGAALGGFLQRRRQTAGDAEAQRRVFGAVLLSGAISGASVGALTWGTLRGGVGGIAAGATFGAVFHPVAVAVLRAASRAERARFGSWLAASDRRAVGTILSLALVVASLLALPSWPAAVVTRTGAPLVALGIAAAGVLACACAVAFDLALLRRLHALGGRHARALAAGSEPLAEVAHLPGQASATALDVGLGDETRVEVDRAGVVYRAHDRVRAVLVGDPAVVRRAVRSSVVIAALGLAASAGAVALHAVAESDPAAVGLYQEARCGADDPQACTSAAVLHSEGRAWFSSQERAAALLSAGCWNGDPDACALEQRMILDGRLPARNALHLADVQRAACARGDALADCRRTVDETLAGKIDRGTLRALGPLLDGSCRAGEARACLEQKVLGSLPNDDADLPLVTRCLRGFAVECSILGDRGWDEGELEPPASVRAAGELACTYGIATSCDHVARATRYAVPGIRDREERRLAHEEAVRLFERACDLGALFSCCEAAFDVLYAREGPGEVERAQAFWDRAEVGHYGNAGACALARWGLPRVRPRDGEPFTPGP